MPRTTYKNDLFFTYFSGLGRLRSDITLTPKDPEEIRGVLLTTGERSLKMVFDSEDTGKLNQGIFRRVVQIPAAELDLKGKEVKGKFLSRLTENYGHLFVEWIEHIKSEDVIERIRFLSEDFISRLEESGMHFSGQERAIGLLYAVVQEAGKFFGFETHLYDDILFAIAEDTYDMFKENVEDDVEAFRRVLGEFIAENRDCFIVEGEEKQRITKFYGKATKDKLYLTAKAFDEIARRARRDSKYLKKVLVKSGLMEKGKDGRIAKRTTVSILPGVNSNLTSVNVYVLSLSKEEVVNTDSDTFLIETELANVDF